MSAPFAPIDRDVLTEFRRSDEHALERIFRNEYAALTELAAAESGEPASASRIVEGAFLDAWSTRERLETPEALEEFLRREVHTRAVRERSRRAAAHRLSSFEGGSAHAEHAGPAPVDQAWTHLAAVLHAPPPDVSRSARLVADVTRHDAAEHVASIAKKRSWVAPMVAIVAALIALALAGRWLDRASRIARVDSALDSPDSRVVSTQLGQRASATLLDGSEAQLAPDTKLSIPPGFGEDLRAVKLDGAASFVVAQGAQLPFIVRAKGVRITATGTTFDVSAFPDDQAVTVRVREGTVQVKVGGSTRSLSAGNALAITADGAMTGPSDVAREEALAWTEGRFAAVDRPLREVVPLIRRWYKITLLVPDSAIMSRKATVRAPLDSPKDALAAMESQARVAVTYQGKQMVLRDSSAVASPARAKGRGSR